MIWLTLAPLGFLFPCGVEDDWLTVVAYSCFADFDALLLQIQGIKWTLGTTKVNRLWEYTLLLELVKPHPGQTDPFRHLGDGTDFFKITLQNLFL
ncbi:MAG: hypothetical protein ACW987_10550 [Candidatus Thorarchaeota archaeon]|jgi:hypothetical protein